jgi:hypothetical protein
MPKNDTMIGYLCDIINSPNYVDLPNFRANYLKKCGYILMDIDSYEPVNGSWYKMQPTAKGMWKWYTVKKFYE